MTHPATLPAMGMVAAVSVTLALMAVRAYVRSGNPNLRFVAAGFSIFGIKGIFAAVVLARHTVPHEDLELILGLFDVVALLVLAFPFVRRGRR